MGLKVGLIYEYNFVRWYEPVHPLAILTNRLYQLVEVAAMVASHFYSLFCLNNGFKFTTGRYRVFYGVKWQHVHINICGTVNGSILIQILILCTTCTGHGNNFSRHIFRWLYKFNEKYRRFFFTNSPVKFFFQLPSIGTQTHDFEITI